ncbi:MAG: oxygen-independent coproporphyrinogen III oxidase [Pseudomonadales bacterium]
MPRSADAIFDPELIQRYDVNGPRYTSYPTANLFTESFGAADYRQSLAALSQRPAPLPLSLYVHVPFCATICYYCACNKIVTANRRHADAYLERLHREIELMGRLLPERRHVEQLHFGGGTPTYLSDAQFQNLFAALRRHLGAVPDEAARDYSIEIDPRTVDARRIRFLTGLGINRISIGIQDFDPAVQAAVNRIQSEAETRAVIEAGRDGGVHSVSVDLIYGLPLQTPERFAATLTKTLALQPDRIALYNYAHLPQRFKTQRQINVVDLPSAQHKLGLLQLAVATITDAGYHYIGMDHFARPDDSLTKAQREGGLHRNFQGYTTHGHCELVGLGVSAISSVAGTYAQNAKTLEDYYRLVDSGELPVERGLRLDSEDLLRRDLIGTLMCHFQLNVAAFEQRHSICFADHFAEALARLAPLAADGLVRIMPDRIEVTARGRFLIRNVCMAFDAYLGETTQGFSKAI